MLQNVIRHKNRKQRNRLETGGQTDRQTDRQTDHAVETQITSKSLTAYKPKSNSTA